MQDNDFPSIELEPERPFDRIRELYLYEEPALLASIRRGDRKEATRIINLVLLHIYSVGEERSELLKGLLLELVVMMSRAAVEAGAPQSEVLGLRFQHLTELAEIRDDEQMARWLRETVVRIFEVVERCVSRETPVLVGRILKTIREEGCSPLTRDEVAKKAGVSAAHMAQLLRERTGRSFTYLVREARIERACELLGNPEMTVAAIAIECGFCDQSYFTHVFQDLKKATPKQYRCLVIERAKNTKKKSENTRRAGR